MKISKRSWACFALVGSLVLGGCYTARVTTGPESGSDKAAQSLQRIHESVDTSWLSPGALPKKWGGAGASGRYETKSIIGFCTRDEADFDQIRRTVLVPWEESWIRKDASVLLSLLSQDAWVQPLAFETTKSVRNLGGIEIRERKAALEEKGRSPKAEIEGFLKNFSNIEDVELVGTEILSPPSLRDSDMRIRESSVIARFDIRGLDQAGARREERGKFRIHVLRDGQGWKVSRVQVLSQESLRSSRAPAFNEVTASSGVTTVVKSHLRREAIRRGGYALAVGDFDSDKKVDLLVGTAGAPSLLKGDGQGHFTPVEVQGFEKQTYVKAAAFADLRNDGRQDIVMSRFVPGVTGASIEQRRNDIAIYRNDGKGAYSESAPIVDSGKTDYAMPLSVADLNGDGLLDFYVGFPGAKDFTFYYDVTQNPELKVQGLYMNQGDGTFKAGNLSGIETADSKTRKPSGTAALPEMHMLFPHSALTVDYDRDGWMDIIVTDDRGNLSPVYHNVGGQRFEQVAESIGVANSNFGMSVAAGDLMGTGNIDLVMSNANFSALNRVIESCRKNWEYIGWNEMPGLKLFRGHAGAKYSDDTQVSGLEWAGEGLAGIELVDYNLDGRPDIFVSNGLWTGNDRREDLSSLFARSYIAPEDRYAGERSLLEVRTDTKSVFMDVLVGYQGSLTDKKPSSARPGMAGRQHKRLFRNEGNGHFTEVGFFEGVDSIADGYVVARADLYGTGRPDLVLRSGDPGVSEDQFPTVQLFRNMNIENNHPLKVALKGSRSNSDAIGAEVTVKTASGTQLQQLMGNNGAAQSEKALFFGLGKHSVAQKVTVRWPSGKIQELKNVRSGTILVTEPASSPMAQAKAN